jgi:UDP-N-acetylmuramoyl-L-alanyl-D-glutamate--2,6-diaminopimelate ligase
MIRFLNSQKSLISSLANGSPSTKIKVIGVAGSRGKTITAHMLHHILKQGGVNAGYITTSGYSTEPLKHQKDTYANVMDSVELNKILAQMLKNGLTHAVVEVNSSGLKKRNFEGITFDSGILTNIFFDRPDDYENWEDYANTKIEFLSKVKEGGLVVFNNHNADISNWILNEASKIKNSIYSYWVDFNKLGSIRHSVNNVSFEFEGSPFVVPAIGTANIFNAAQAAKLAQAYLPPASINAALTNYEPVKGRMEVIQRQPFTVLIDYAYTPDMLEDALMYLHLIKPYNSKIITVLGASGDQHKERRRIAASAAKYSGLVVLVAEDPRSERTADINTELHLRAQPNRAVLVERIGSQEEYAWVNKDNLRTKIERVKTNSDIPFVAFDAEDFTSRLNGIDFAIKSANPGDIVFVVGKGDEDTLSFSHVDYEWSDAEAVRQALLGKV